MRLPADGGGRTWFCNLYDAWETLPPARRDELDGLTGIHTIKGSGRMVGLNELGELAYDVEKIHNRLLEEERAVTPAMLQNWRYRASGGRGPRLATDYRLGIGWHPGSVCGCPRRRP